MNRKAAGDLFQILMYILGLAVAGIIAVVVVRFINLFNRRASQVENIFGTIP